MHFLSRNLPSRAVTWGVSLSAVAALLLLIAPAHAQSPWKPDRRVTIVVPNTPGGGTDTTARALARQFEALWRQPVVVENLPGADGLIGTRRVIDSKPDGYTLLMQIPSIVLAKHLPEQKGVDPLARLDPVTAVAQSPYVVVVSAKVPVKTMDEFVRYCKAQPCSLAMSEPQGRLLTKQLVSDTGLSGAVMVNYRGGTALASDLIANTVNMSFSGINSVLPHHNSGTLRILATMSQKRAAVLPNVPTTAEAGFGQYLASNWFGLFAPKGTPQAAIDGIVAAVRVAIVEPEMLKVLTAGATEPSVVGQDAFVTQLKEDNDRLGTLLRKFPFE